MKNSLLLAVAAGVALLAVSAQAQFQWAKRIASTVNPDDELSIGMTLDSQGNAYVTGWFDGTNDFGGVVLTNRGVGGQDLFLAKYDPTGVLQWARRAGSATPYWNMGRGVGLDANGNVYVAGGFRGDADFGATVVSAPQNTEFCLAKYNSAGTVQWVRQSTGGTSGGVYGTGLAVDSAGNSYAVGFADNGATITFGAVSLLNTNSSGYSTFLVKYDNAGTLQWAQLLSSPSRVYATKVAVDAIGNVCVQGGFSVDITIGASKLVSVGGKDMFIAKFDKAGALAWVRQEGGTGDEGGEGGVAVDLGGNVYVTGAFGSSQMNFGSTSLTNAGLWDAFVAKYNSSGTFQWARQAGGTNLDLYWDVTLDGQGNAYAAGVLGADAAAPNGSGGALVAKYDPAGTLQWASPGSGQPANPVAALAAKCAVDSIGNCYLAGWYQTAPTFGTNVLQPQGTWNYFLAKLAAPPTNAPAITSQPASRTNLVGTTATFTVTATGTAPLAYQWRFNGANLANGGSVSGVTTTNLTLANVQLASIGDYSAVVSNASGSVTSAVAVLTVHAGSPLGDDFNASTNGPSKWAPDIHAGPGGQYVQTNGYLQFLGSDAVVRFWIGSFGSYTQDLELILDVNLGVLPQDNSSIAVGLELLSLDGPVLPTVQPPNNLGLSLGMTRISGQNYRAFGARISTNGARATESIAVTTNQHGSVRVTFDAATKTLTSWYDASGDTSTHHWTALATQQINVPPIDWGMTDGSAFGFVLTTHSDGYTVTASDQVYVDNFLLYGSVAGAVTSPPQLQITRSGPQVLLSWLTNAPDFVLETGSNLSAVTVWRVVTNAVTISGNCFWVTNRPASNPAFYRLRQQTNSPAPAGMVLIPAGPFVVGDTLDGDTSASSSGILKGF